MRGRSPGQSKRQERLALMKRLKQANKKARKLNEARRAREAKAFIAVAEPEPVNVAAQPGSEIDVVYDDVRHLVESK